MMGPGKDVYRENENLKNEIKQLKKQLADHQKTEEKLKSSLECEKVEVQYSN